MEDVITPRKSAHRHSLWFLVPDFKSITHCVTPASQNTLKRRRDESRRRIYARKIPHVYAL